MTRTLLLTSCLASVFGCGSSSTGTTNDNPDGQGPTADATAFTTGVSTLAGAAETGAEDGNRAVARFSNPVNVARAPDGTVYVADFDNGMIRSIDSVGNVATVIKQAGFVRPFGMAFAADGTLFVQTDNDPTGAQSATAGTIWRIDLAGHLATVVKTGLGRPRGLAVLPDGRLAMADYEHHVIQTMVPSTGVVATLAGTWDAKSFADAPGAAARFSSPYGVAVRADGQLVVTDFGNQRIRLVDPTTGTTTTLAGNGNAGFADGAAASAQFNQPQAIAIDAAGDIYVTDTNNYRVRRIRGTTVDTVAGDGTPGYQDANDRMAAELYGLEGISVSPDGSMLFVADGNRGENVPYNRVREIDMTH